jgi:hypothetical protein
MATILKRPSQISPQPCCAPELLASSPHARQKLLAFSHGFNRLMPGCVRAVRNRATNSDRLAVEVGHARNGVAGATDEGGVISLSDSHV